LTVYVGALHVELAQAEAASSLPAEPDVAAVEALVVDLQRLASQDLIQMGE
jgi:predicted trehalose synthase